MKQKFSFPNPILLKQSSAVMTPAAREYSKKYRSQRNSHTNSHKNIMLDLRSEYPSPSKDTDYVNQKSEMLMKMDKQLIDNIQKKMNLKKLNSSKMSILSMQKTKFKVSRGKSTLRSLSPSNLSYLSSSKDKKTQRQKSQIDQLQSLNNNRRDGQNNGKKSQVQCFKSYMAILLLNHPKKPKSRKGQILTTELIKYFIETEDQNLKRDLLQIKTIGSVLAKCLQQDNYNLNLNILRKIDRDIGKLVFNVCYEMYRKKQKGVGFEELIKINKQIQYTARRLKFYDLALRTCFDTGSLYCDKMDYDKAFKQFSNAVKLSVFLNNKFMEQNAIDKLGLCKYYMGDSVSAVYFHNNTNYLSNYDSSRIKQQYSNDKQIKRLLEEKKQLKINRAKKTKTNFLNEENLDPNDSQLLTDDSIERVDMGEFTFSKENRRELYPINNNIQFKENLKKIIKVPIFRHQIQLMKRSVKKNDEIGKKKYVQQAKSMFPQPSKCYQKQNSVQLNEVCLSHRSYNRNNIQIQTFKVQRESKILLNMLHYFLNEHYIGQNRQSEMKQIQETIFQQND